MYENEARAVAPRPDADPDPQERAGPRPDDAQAGVTAVDPDGSSGSMPAAPAAGGSPDEAASGAGEVTHPTPTGTAPSPPASGSAGAYPAEHEPLAMPEPPVTGEPAVDRALDRLGDVGGRQTVEHVAIYDDVHRQLSGALADIDEGD